MAAAKRMYTEVSKCHVTMQWVYKTDYSFTKSFLHKQQLHVTYRVIFDIHVFSSLSGKWSLPDINGQPPPSSYSFTLTPVGERRAALFGGIGLWDSNNLFIVDLSRHTVVSGECYKPGSHAILTCMMIKLSMPSPLIMLWIYSEE